MWVLLFMYPLIYKGKEERTVINIRQLTDDVYKVDLDITEENASFQFHGMIKILSPEEAAAIVPTVPQKGKE